jgi:phosphoribosyl 1,2-cyclic phosphodiesterase
LKKRISGGFGHLSNTQSAGAMFRVMGPRVRHIVATHLSRTNNTPEIVRAMLTRLVERSGWNVPFSIADQIQGLEAFDA